LQFEQSCNRTLTISATQFQASAVSKNFGNIFASLTLTTKEFPLRRDALRRVMANNPKPSPGDAKFPTIVARKFAAHLSSPPIERRYWVRFASY
jgi:hypothetical protein